MTVICPFCLSGKKLEPLFQAIFGLETIQRIKHGPCAIKLMKGIAGDVTFLILNFNYIVNSSRKIVFQTHKILEKKAIYVHVVKPNYFQKMEMN